MARREPPPEFENASWRETLQIIGIVFQTLAVPLVFMAGTLLLLVWILLALLSNVWTVIFPLGIIGLMILWFVRRDRQEAAKLIAERDGMAAPGPRRPGL